MTKEWFTAAELAGLPGLPSTPQNVTLRAKRDSWKSRKRKAVGGGREFHFNSLPVETQAAVLARLRGDIAEVSKPVKRTLTVDRENLWDAFERRPQTMKDVAAHRLQVLQAVERLVASGTLRTQAIQEVVKVMGESRPTIYRWFELVQNVDRSDWLAALVPGYIGRTIKAECSDEAWEFFKSQYLRAEAPAVATCYEWMTQAAAKHGWTVPALRTVNRWVHEIPRTVRVLAREGEVALMQIYPSQQRTVRDLYAMFWINGDGYQHNVFVKFPDGTVGRPKTWFWQDIYSRRVLAKRTDRTEHSDMIRLALGDVIEKYGIPEHATIDNTRAAANKWMTAGVKTRYRFKVREEDPIGLMPQLNIQVHWTSVHKGKGHGQAKPVERAFGVGGLGEYVDKHPRFAGAYTGPNTSAKPENYGETAVAWDVFVKTLDEAIGYWNQREGRRTEICNGQMSFESAFNQSYERNAHLIRKPTDAQRRMWMLTAEHVTVQRDGAVALSAGTGPQGKNRYSCDALLSHAGTQVVVRFDPERLHECVHIYKPDGRYIGQADCIHAAGFGDTSAGRERNRLRKAQLKAAKAAAAAESRMTALDAAALMPQPEPEAPLQTNVVRVPFEHKQKKVSGSDIEQPAPQSIADKYKFDDAVARMHERWRQEN